MNPSTTLMEPGWHDARRVAHSIGRRLPAENIALDAACGRVLGTELRALGPVPSYTSSAMDGWAVAGPGPWQVTGTALAGAPSTATLGPGEAVEIATGGMIPRGATAVLRSERGTVIAGLLRAEKDPAAGRHVRPAGEEAAEGDVLAPAGTVLTPPLVGLAAAAGHDDVQAVPLPSVTVLLLGDEIVRSGVAGPGEVRDALGPQLGAFVGLLGGHCARTVLAPDRLAPTVAALREADTDVVVTTGGTAAGPRDLLHDAIAEAGGSLVIDTVAVRPGHPMLLARLPGGRTLVGLPGNPLAASVGLLTLLAPVLRGMGGLPLAPLTRQSLAAPLTTSARATRLVPVRRTPTGLAATGWLGSGMLRGLAGADTLAVVPPGGEATTAEVLALPW